MILHQYKMMQASFCILVQINKPIVNKFLDVGTNKQISTDVKYNEYVSKSVIVLKILLL